MLILFSLSASLLLVRGLYQTYLLVQNIEVQTVL